MIQKGKMAVCSEAHHEKPVPLIFTMVFRGAEYWCPKCGAQYGIFGLDQVNESKALKAELEELELQSADFRKACALRTASAMKIDGVFVNIKDIDHATRESLETKRKAYVFTERKPEIINS